jgi:hypothetical protein
LRPIAFTALFNQTLRLTNKGKGLDLNDSFLDQAFPRLPIFGIIHHETENILEREFPLRQIINYSNSIKNSYGLSYDIKQSTKGTK